MSEIFGESIYLQTTGDRPFERPEQGGPIAPRSVENSIQPPLLVTAADAVLHARGNIGDGVLFRLTDEGDREATFVDGALVRLNEPTAQQEESQTVPEPLDSPSEEAAREAEVQNAQIQQEIDEFVEQHAGTVIQAPDGKSYVLLEDGTTREVV